MSKFGTPVPLPTWGWVAVVLPSAVLALVEMLRELGAPAPEVAPAVLAVLWLSTTLPVAALLLAMRAALARQRGPGTPPELPQALEAVARAEAVAARSFQAQAQLHAAVQHQGAATANPAMVPRATARRTMLLACGLVAVFLLSAVGLAAVFTGPAAAPRVQHAHVGLALWVDGDPADLEGLATLPAHGSAPASLEPLGSGGAVLHLHGAPGLTLAEALEACSRIALAEEGLALGRPGEDPLVLQENATHRLRLLVLPAGDGGWVEVKPVLGFVPREGDRVLLSFGAERGAELVLQKGGVPTPPAR